MISIMNYSHLHLFLTTFRDKTNHTYLSHVIINNYQHCQFCKIMLTAIFFKLLAKQDQLYLCIINHIVCGGPTLGGETSLRMLFIHFIS